MVVLRFTEEFPADELEMFVKASLTANGMPNSYNRIWEVFQGELNYVEWSRTLYTTLSVLDYLEDNDFNDIKTYINNFEGKDQWCWSDWTRRDCETLETEEGLTDSGKLYLISLLLPRYVITEYRNEFKTWVRNAILDDFSDSD